jgi:hypothetical protein
MSAFEDFVQVELPLRPFVTSNPDLETIPVRRGPGARQLEFVDLQEGEVLGKVGGVIAGVSISSLTTKSHVHTQGAASTQWVINHAQSSEDYIVQVRNAAGEVIIPDEVTIGDAGGANTSEYVTITFNEATDGKAVITFA